MENSKNKIEKSTTVVKSASYFSGTYGQYRVSVNGVTFETDNLGNLMKSKSGKHYAEWEDLGITCENKKQFVEEVFNYIESN